MAVAGTVHVVYGWSDPRWRADADAWIHARVAELGAVVTGTIEQPHLRVWATVLRVPTDHGTLWFKANAPAKAYEAAVVELLAARRPDAVPGLVAVDRRRGWLLMTDGGTRLRELVEAERDLGRWLTVLPRYAGVQLDLAPDRDALLAAGAPDRRLERLPGLYRDLLAGLDWLPADELDRLRRLAGWVDTSCATLAGFGVPETIQHDDLHDGQVFVRDGDYLFFDWGDACVAHPFLSMAVTLEGVLAWGLDDVADSVDVTPFRDAYLEPFATVADPAELTAGLAIALRLGWLSRVLDQQAIGETHRGEAEYREAIAVRLRLFLVGLPGS